ncbi:hypothetical protein OIU76_004390 [Salix suchowensis]|nr:hypothetical protein OIU76_004390 [Salix suchowensis]
MRVMVMVLGLILIISGLYRLLVLILAKTGSISSGSISLQSNSSVDRVGRKPWIVIALVRDLCLPVLRCALFPLTVWILLLEILDADFDEAAIGRVAPVDSGLLWIILLRAYGKCSGDLSLQERVDVQTGMKMILRLCLADGFDMFPTLLVTDGSCMIDRRMGIHGHPLEIQTLVLSQWRILAYFALAG